MAVHPDVLRVEAQLAALGVKTYEHMSVLQARGVLDGGTRMQLPGIELALVRDILVPGADGMLPARVYHPDPERKLPLMVYAHGGGWVLGGIRIADRPCRRLAAAGECVIVSLDYRRSPETKFPGPLEDVLAATRWLIAHRDEVGAGERTMLMGDSAGGNLAAATALELGDAIDRQILVYPVLSHTPTASYREQGPLLTGATMDWFWGHYLRSPEEGLDPRASPLLASDVSGVAPATIVVAEFDPLRDEGLAYAQRLGVEPIVYVGAAHGFWWMDAEMEQGRELTQRLGALLRDHSWG